MIQCPFNARHWILVNQYPFHKAICSDRYQIEQDIAPQRMLKKGDPDSSPNSDYLPLIEDWDADVELEEYVESRLRLRNARARSKTPSRTSSVFEGNVSLVDESMIHREEVSVRGNRSLDSDSKKSLAIEDGFNNTRPPRSESLSLKGIRALGHDNNNNNIDNNITRDNGPTYAVDDSLQISSSSIAGVES